MSDLYGIRCVSAVWVTIDGAEDRTGTREQLEPLARRYETEVQADGSVFAVRYEVVPYRPGRPGALAEGIGASERIEKAELRVKELSEIVDICERVHTPLVTEDLDLRERVDALEVATRRYITAAEMSVWERNWVHPDYVSARHALRSMLGMTPIGTGCPHPRERWYADREYGTTFCGVCHTQVRQTDRHQSPGMPEPNEADLQRARASRTGEEVRGMRLQYSVERETAHRCDGLQAHLRTVYGMWKWNVTVPTIEGSDGSTMCIAADEAESRSRARASVAKAVKVYDATPKKLTLRERAERAFKALRPTQKEGTK